MRYDFIPVEILWRKIKHTQKRITWPSAKILRNNSQNLKTFNPCMQQTLSDPKTVSLAGLFLLSSSWESDTVNSRYLELCPISNKTVGPFSINSSGVTTRYLELFSRCLRVRDTESWLYLQFNMLVKYLARNVFSSLPLKWWTYHLNHGPYLFFAAKKL